MKTTALLLVLSLAPAFTAAQTPPAYTIVRQGRHTLVRARDVVEVPGNVGRPYPFTVEGRSAPRWQPPPTNIRFTPGVVQAVRRAPF